MAQRYLGANNAPQCHHMQSKLHKTSNAIQKHARKVYVLYK